MRVYSKIVIDMTTDEIVDALWTEYSGPVALCKMSADQGLATYNSKQMMNSFMSDATQRFGAQSGLINQLATQAGNIYAAGPNQQGFSPAEQAALNTQTEEGVASNYQNAKAATNASLANVGGGGNTFLPSSVGAGLTAQNANAAMATKSYLQNQNTLANYAQGRQNWQTSAGILGNAAQLEDPQAFGQLGLSASNQTFNQATTLFNQEQQQQAQVWGMGAGLLGSVLGGPIGGALGSSLGSSLAGGGSGPLSGSFTPSAPVSLGGGVMSGNA